MVGMSATASVGASGEVDLFLQHNKNKQAIKQKPPPALHAIMIIILLAEEELPPDEVGDDVGGDRIVGSFVKTIEGAIVCGRFVGRGVLIVGVAVLVIDGFEVG